MAYHTKSRKLPKDAMKKGFQPLHSVKDNIYNITIQDSAEIVYLPQGLDSFL